MGNAVEGREFRLANETSAAGTNTEVIAAATGKSIEIIWACISVTADDNAKLTAGADAAATRIVDARLLAAGTNCIVFAPSQPYVLPTATALNITTSGAGNVSVSVLYNLVPY